MFASAEPISSLIIFVLFSKFVEKDKIPSRIEIHLKFHMSCATSISAIFVLANKSMNSFAGFMCSLKVVQTTLVRGDECCRENFLNATTIFWPP